MALKFEINGKSTSPNTFKNLFEDWLTHKCTKVADITYKDLNNF